MPHVTVQVPPSQSLFWQQWFEMQLPFPLQVAPRSPEPHSGFRRHDAAPGGGPPHATPRAAPRTRDTSTRGRSKRKARRTGISRQNTQCRCLRTAVRARTGAAPPVGAARTRSAQVSPSVGGPLPGAGRRRPRAKMDGPGFWAGTLEAIRGLQNSLEGIRDVCMAQARPQAPQCPALQVQSRQPWSAQVPQERTTCFFNASRARNTRTAALLLVMPASTA